MNKKTRRQIKKAGRQVRKTTKTLRKALKRAGGPAGLATGALALGGLAAAVSPVLRERTRTLAGSARDFFERLASNTQDDEHADKPLLEHTH
jgi:hypothetical protein